MLVLGSMQNRTGSLKKIANGTLNIAEAENIIVNDKMLSLVENEEERNEEKIV